jgi:hypothetical protein
VISEVKNHMKNKKVFIFLTIAFLLIPLLTYTINFCGQSFSRDTEVWGQFGDYLNGTFMPLIALAGIFVTLSLGLISEKRNVTNLKIEQQKQRPLLHLGYFDSEDHLEIFLKNKGNGPLIITDYQFVNIKDNSSMNSIFECLPKIEGHFDNYTGNQNNMVLSTEEEQQLFLFNSGNDNTKTYEKDKMKIRETLAQFKIVIDYKDVYDNPMPTYERSLEWFGRNLTQKSGKHN